MIHVRLRWCLVFAAMLLAMPNANLILQRLSSGPGFRAMNGPDGFLWLPFLAVLPTLLAAIGTLPAEVRRNIRLLSPSMPRDVFVIFILSFATISLLLIALCLLIIKSKGGSGGFEMLGSILGWFVGWCALGIVGIIDIMYVSTIARYTPNSQAICRSCGYDLRGSPESALKGCPECGHRSGSE